jgi:hypothetical protein
MHGDFTRWTHRPEEGFRSVLLQQGRILLDADWNEAGEITRRHDEVRTLDIVGRTGTVAGSEAYAVLDAVGAEPVATPWAELRIGAGRYYVDGILVESGGFALADQPFLQLDEPENGRYGVHLDVWTRQVSADEDPSLRESALGGPDTTTRAQTVGQVRLFPNDDATHCSDLAAADVLARVVPTMIASLQEAPSDADPCAISESGGYQLLENQLYRVQIHQPARGAAPATYCWSRENGSVVAGLLAVEPVTGEPTQAVLLLDRVGRDEELSIGGGSLLELTSATRQLRGEPGVLATAGSPVGTTVPITWLDGSITLAELGEHPLVRRWEGGPTEVGIRPRDLEGGVQVAFPQAADCRPGDHWLIPARTVRLGYGVDARTGTIEWPTDELGEPLARPPAGPDHHTAPLGILRRDGDLWTLESDCRPRFPALTSLVTLDLLGGDGQEAMPGEALPAPVRVGVRNGGLPLPGAAVQFLASDGGEVSIDAVTWSTTLPFVATDGDGVAQVHWRPVAGGPDSQILTVRRVDDHGRPIAPDVVVTGRLSVARQVAWQPGCDGFTGTRTVQDALAQLTSTRTLTLLGGDGQHVVTAGSTVPQPVRVLLDSPCGPVTGVEVIALATDAGLVQAASDDATPASLSPPAADRTAVAVTDALGVASFWWQPALVGAVSDTLDIASRRDRAAIRVGAQLAAAGGRTTGVHIVKTRFGIGRGFGNDTAVSAEELVSGIRVDLDREVDPAAVKDRPVVRVALDLPWPVEGDGDLWSEIPVGVRRVELAAAVGTDAGVISWEPTDPCRRWLIDRLWDVLARADAESVTGWFEIDGWAVPAADGSGHLNGHAVSTTVSGRTDLVLPTTDEVTGGQFRQWFRLVRERVLRPGFVEVPDVSGRTFAVAERILNGLGLVCQAVDAGPSPRRKGLVVGTRPEAFGQAEAGSTVTVLVSAGLR